MAVVLDEKFFNRDTSIVAKDLLGKFLVRKIGNKKISVMITETEAYDGPSDRASHAFKGKTKRTKVMFGKPGIFYIYLCYGVHNILNVITQKNGYPAAVLVRGCLYDNLEVNGPGKITKLLKINKNFNNKEARKDSELWFEDREIKINKMNIKKTPRIGVSYAGSKWSNKKLRFVIDNLY